MTNNLFYVIVKIVIFIKEKLQKVIFDNLKWVNKKKIPYINTVNITEFIKIIKSYRKKNSLIMKKGSIRPKVILENIKIIFFKQNFW